MLPEIVPEMEGGAKHFVLQSLTSNNVNIHVNAKVVEIQDDSVVIEIDGTIRTLPAAQVIIATGSSPNKNLTETIAETFPTDTIGDAAEVGEAWKA